MRSRILILQGILLFCLRPTVAAEQSPPDVGWMARSDANTRILLDVQTRFSPETVSDLGLEQFDRQVRSLPLDLPARQTAALTTAIHTLEQRLASETHPVVRQDLQILLRSANLQLRGIELNERRVLPYFNLHREIYESLHSLLDEQVPQARRIAALTRLQRYAGLERGYVPIVQQAIAYIQARLEDGNRIAPFRDHVERDLATREGFIDGIEELFRKYDIKGFEPALRALRTQLAEYDTFLRREILPKAREDFRLPEELYRHNLALRGIDMPLEELISRSKTAFSEIQNEMQTIAPLVAKEKGYATRDYRAVIRELKKQQFIGDAIVPHYKRRITDLERLIHEHRIVSLPTRGMQIRLASVAESVAVPMANFQPGRLLGNTGEMGTFVLPLRIAGGAGKGELAFDDFTFEAATWTLSVHEGRPGHELQFASLVEKGVSLARLLYGFNSVNVEGWALYMEAEMKPFMPLEGQLIALQHRLLRAARAFIDPSLHLGRMTREEAYRILEEDGVFSHAMAVQEVERYTFRTPGQAPSYFVGYSRLMELRTNAEAALGSRFDRQSYHDFILAQGLLTPALLHDAVINHFVAPRRNKTSLTNH